MKVTTAILCAATAAACQSFSNLPDSVNLTPGDTLEFECPADSFVLEATQLTAGTKPTLPKLIYSKAGISKWKLVVPDINFPDSTDLANHQQYLSDRLFIVAYNRNSIGPQDSVCASANYTIATDSAKVPDAQEFPQTAIRSPTAKAQPIIRSTRKVTYDLIGRVVAKQSNYQFLVRR
jgi:hypothetical protein